MFEVTLSIPYGGGMKIYIGPGYYPDVARAPQDGQIAGETMPTEVDPSKGY